MADFVFPEELEYFVQSITPFYLHEIGGTKWLEVHEIIIKLSQQAILEAVEHREEAVRESLVAHNKLCVLVHEAYSVLLWKTRVLPYLLEVDPNPQATFLIYTVLFHEGAAINLLDVALFHPSACESLREAAIDLIDYAVTGISQTLGLVSMGFHENDTNIDVDEATLTELDRQKRELIYKIGLRCISILNYLVDKVEVLPSNAGRRLLITHDLPWLLGDLLHLRPWQRRTKHGLQKFIEDKWVNATNDLAVKVTKQEAQTWFCLRQIMLNPQLLQIYEFNEDRRKHLANCAGLLNEVILDQAPPLMDLKQMLCNLSVGGVPQTQKTKVHLMLEEVPEIRENIIKKAESMGGFFEVARRQEKVFLSKDQNQLFDLAKKLNSAYNTDLLAEYEEKAAEAAKVSENLTKAAGDPNLKQCANCGKSAVKKCATCRSIYYCSRECQLKQWSSHKATCKKN